MSDPRATIGAKGRLVLPAAIREGHGWHVGTELVVVDSESGVALISRESLKRIVRQQLAGADLVGELITERRRNAEVDDQ